MLDAIIHHWEPILAVGIFGVVFVAIVFEIFDKAIVAMAGAGILVLTRVLTFEQAIEAINFEIIALLAAMMILVEIAQESGLFTLINFKLAKFSKGNPFLIFLFFMLVTAFASAFLDNVTTILIVVPITIALVRGMGYNPFPFIIGEIMFSNIGGALTLVGDPPNILVGTMAGISFNSFIVHLWIPILIIIVLILVAFYVIRWKDLKPIHHHLPKLFLSNLLLKKIQYQFLKTKLDARYMITVAVILGLTIVGFLMQFVLNYPLAVIAFAGAIILMLVVHKKIHVHHVLSKVEWPTLGFFAGLFVLAHGLEEVGILKAIGHSLVGVTDNFALLILIVVWSAGILSMVIDNIPFVTVMIPIIFNMQEVLGSDPHFSLLWWALVLGACLGGNGTIIGASANVIGVDLARNNGVKITFLSYLRYSLPLTLLTLVVSSVYLMVWYFYF
ncbi:ArsB/NhaD family transporter [Patescibacteria group bacterium]|nr:ArsB/NhaD family transporter [Patescibacteria group bacterium]MBU1682494.1 ArsB/NhaD family transporter [Patescibacteria group bacterium]MBU1935280.1 ArsB/NhaD family transporter [Patescibacteria group bacterium]